MKRLLALAVLGLMAAAFVSYAAYVERPALRAADDDFIDPPVTRTVPAPLVAAESDSSAKLNRLREHLLDRTKAKIELMSEEDIRRALEATDSEIRVMQARQKLDETAATLRTIVKEFNGTPSADLAKQMIELHDRGGEGNYGAGYYPGPTPTTESVPYGAR
jgi:hypothetical protein